MGLFDTIKGQLANVVEWADMDEGTLFHKWQNIELKKGSKLIIRPAQDAIFLYQGRIEGIFTDEGEYDIESQIIPFLSTLKGFKFGFDSGIRAEVVFINTREFNVPWGTQNPINLPVQGLPGGMPIRAFGMFACRIDDFKVLIDKIAGTNDQYTVEEVRMRISAINDSLLMKGIASEGKDMFNLQANAVEIADSIKANLDVKLREIGLTVTDYTIQNVSYPDNVREMQEKAAGQAMVSDVNKYTQMQMADGMAKGDGNMGGAMASMQMGMMMGQQMANNMAGNQKAAQGNGTVPNFCPNCGTPTDGANFCKNCGQKLA